MTKFIVGPEEQVRKQSGNIDGGGGDARLDSHGNEDESFMNKLKLFAKIFGMSFEEVLHLSGDLIQLIGAGGWEAVTGWKDGYDWKEWAYRYVPNHVDDQTLLLVLTLLSAHSLSPKVSQQHLESNTEAWEEYLKLHPDDYYIEHQEDMRDKGDPQKPNNIKDGLHYGNHEAYYNSCEVIAVYNALLALHDGNSPTGFPELLCTFEQGGICADGEFGTAPTALYVYFEKRGYEAKMLSGKQIKDSKLNNMQKEYDTYILTAYNDGDDLGEMIHTVSITAEAIDGETKYQIHNASDTAIYDSLAEAVGGFHGGNGEPISIIGVRPV